MADPKRHHSSSLGHGGGGHVRFASLRSTQRAPKSCRPCSSRKVRCDKAIPCSTCIRRGEADQCVRETVIVRGQITTAKGPSNMPTYDQLLQENTRLKYQLSEGSKSPEMSTQVYPNRRDPTLNRPPDPYENVLFAKKNIQSTSPGKMDWSQISIPSRQSSYSLVAQDRLWNSWVHYALEYPQFEEEHEQIINSLTSGTQLSEIDPFRLAVYFSVMCTALLTMDHDEVENLGITLDDQPKLMHNWYDASIFCLHQADFLRKPNLRSLQTIAILGITFINFGDHDLYRIMWAAAFAIAREVGIDKTHPPPGVGMSPEACHRLWWTFVICEWLALPYHAFAVVEEDFDVPLPTVDPQGQVFGPDGSLLHPVQYHIFMAQAATVLGRFQVALHRTEQPIGDIVRKADEETNEIISILPPHLQPNSRQTEESDALEATFPWVGWQRTDVPLVLLHQRLRINRVLQRYWQVDPEQFGWAQANCISIAKDIIWLAQNWDTPAAKRRQWALTAQVYAAATFLYQEAQQGSLSDQLDWRIEISKCLVYLDLVSSRNVIAGKAAETLRGFLGQHEVTSHLPHEQNPLV